MSHLIYDGSDLYRWKWFHQLTEGLAIKRGVFCHAGFDDASALLAMESPDVEWLVLDHYDPVFMTEASIQRARRANPPCEGAIACPQSKWPLQDSWAELVVGFLAIHEFRTIHQRADWFREASRCTHRHGNIILVEHLRDGPNLLAFGPGAFHFHTAAAWAESWELAGLRLAKQRSVTPWIKIYLLEK